MSSSVKIADAINLKNIYDEIINQYETIVIDFIICSDDNTKILVQKRSLNRKYFPDTWEVTGGKLENNETILDCIVREMKEETSMELTEILGLIHKFTWNDNSSLIVNLQFLVKAKGEFQPELDKISDYKWIGKDEIEILNNKNQEENQIYKGVLYAFGFLDNLVNGRNQHNFSFAAFLDDLICKFYIFNEIKEPSPKIIVENLPEGSNIIRDIKNNVLKINIKLISSTDLFFTSIIVLHDLYHNLKQGISSHDDVLLIRDLFDYNTMLLIDIDADIEIYRFLAKYYNFDFSKYIRTLYNGHDVFRNTVARLPKVQRFIGSMLSIYHYSITNIKIIFFPCITKIHDKIFLLAISKGIEFKQVELSHEEIERVINTFQHSDRYTEQEFVGILNTIAQKLETNM